VAGTRNGNVHLARVSLATVMSPPRSCARPRETLRPRSVPQLRRAGRARDAAVPDPAPPDL